MVKFAGVFFGPLPERSCFGEQASSIVSRRIRNGWRATSPSVQSRRVGYGLRLPLFGSVDSGCFCYRMLENERIIGWSGKLCFRAAVWVFIDALEFARLVLPTVYVILVGWELNNV